MKLECLITAFRSFEMTANSKPKTDRKHKKQRKTITKFSI